MNFTKEQLEGFKQDPLMNFFAKMLGTSMEEIVSAAEKESHAREMSKAKPVEAPCENTSSKKEEDELGKRIERFFDKMVANGKASVTIEDGHPHYSIKSDDRYKESGNPETLVEESPTTSFSMSKEDLAGFINSYTKLENTFRKLEHTYGISLDASADSIYNQYNTIVWNLIENIFGDENREDICDYCFGDSNFDTVEDLYEELV